MNPARYWTRIAFLLLLLASVSAKNLTQHLIEIDVDAEGKAKVTERFFFSFDSQREQTIFRNQVQQLGASLESWHAFDNQITNYIGEVQNGRIAYEEKEGDRFVKLEYQLVRPLFSKSQGVRQTNYQLDSSQFEALREASIYVIPGNTKIIISLPKQAQIDVGSIQPALDPSLLEQAAQNKRVIWFGYLTQSGKLSLNYFIENEIAPRVTLSTTLIQLWESGEAKIGVAAVLVLLGIGYFKRKSIQQKIEHYLIENSSLKPRQEDETELEP